MPQGARAPERPRTATGAQAPQELRAAGGAAAQEQPPALVEAAGPERQCTVEEAERPPAAADARLPEPPRAAEDAQILAAVKEAEAALRSGDLAATSQQCAPGSVDLLVNQLRAFYGRHNPEKVDDAAQVARLFVGKEEDLNAKLRARYSGADLSSDPCGPQAV